MGQRKRGWTRDIEREAGPEREKERGRAREREVGSEREVGPERERDRESWVQETAVAGERGEYGTGYDRGKGRTSEVVDGRRRIGKERERPKIVRGTEIIENGKNYMEGSEGMNGKNKVNEEREKLCERNERRKEIVREK